LVGVPAVRVRACNQAPLRGDGEFVLYWMIAARRAVWNFALQRAVEHAVRLSKPLVVLEALRSGYRWASERLHAFVIEGMADNARAFAGTSATYVPYVEPTPGAGKGMVEALAARASIVVTDDTPVFFLPRMVAATAARLPVLVLLEAVDGNGLLPLAATEAVYPTAFAFRRFLQDVLPAHLEEAPAPAPLAGVRLPRLTAFPKDMAQRWSAASAALLAGTPEALAALPVDHRVGRVAEARGGSVDGSRLLRRFLNERLAGYAETRNQPEQEGTSGLSPYLHFGHVSAYQVFAAVAEREGWTAERLASRASGKRAGWWGMSAAAETFLDQLVTWREVGFNFVSKRDDAERYESLPPWARATMEKHAGDQRPHVYTLEQLERAATHDPLWNAAQVQLLREGRIHNYLRMLWGKKILEWSPSPKHALEVMLELNNRFALDGRDPNSTSGILWCLGRYDRPWGPERPILGTVRYMSSENTARKMRVGEYLARYTP
jgi:deoxyribodipyrimidine photo-lyase